MLHVAAEYPFVFADVPALSGWRLINWPVGRRIYSAVYMGRAPVP